MGNAKPSRTQPLTPDGHARAPSTSWNIRTRIRRLSPRLWRTCCAAGRARPISPLPTTAPFASPCWPAALPCSSRSTTGPRRAATASALPALPTPRRHPHRPTRSRSRRCSPGRHLRWREGPICLPGLPSRAPALCREPPPMRTGAPSLVQAIAPPPIQTDTPSLVRAIGPPSTQPIAPRPTQPAAPTSSPVSPTPSD